MPKRYDRSLGWVDDDLGLVHSRDLDAWVRADGVIRFKDGRVVTVDSLLGEESAKGKEAQRRASKLQPKPSTPQAPAGSALPPPPSIDSFQPVAQAMNLPAEATGAPAAAPMRAPAPKRQADPLASFATLLRGGP